MTADPVLRNVTLCLTRSRTILRPNDGFTTVFQHIFTLHAFSLPAMNPVLNKTKLIIQLNMFNQVCNHMLTPQMNELSFIFYMDFKSSDTMTKATEIAMHQKVRATCTSQKCFPSIFKKQRRRKSLGRRMAS
jgi:hypothetical protein